jgi:hypothetical protein
MNLLFILDKIQLGGIIIFTASRSRHHLWPIGAHYKKKVRVESRRHLPSYNIIPFPYPLDVLIKVFGLTGSAPFFYVTSHCTIVVDQEIETILYIQKRHVESRVQNRKGKTEANSGEMPDNFSLDVTWWRQQILRRLWCQRFLLKIQI